MLGGFRGVVAVGCFTLGCSGSEQGDAPRPERTDWFGAITVNLRESRDGADAQGLVSGTIYDGPSPLEFALETVLTVAECQLREVAHPFCDPPCGSAAVCVRDGECMPYPHAQDAGELQVTGLAEPVTLTPFAPNFFYQSQPLGFPPCDEGATLRLSAPAFAAETRCVAPLVAEATEPVRVQSGEAVALTWEEPSEPELAQIQILLDVSHHGGKKGDVLCVVPDTGHYEIPAELVTPLVELGLAGYPSVILTRTSSAESDPAGVDFVVSASVERAVDTGVTSCVPNPADDPCPSGETCDPKTNLCR